MLYKVWGVDFLKEMIELTPLLASRTWFMMTDLAFSVLVF